MSASPSSLGAPAVRDDVQPVAHETADRIALTVVTVGFHRHSRTAASRPPGR